MLNRMNFSGTWRDYQARVLEEIDEHFEDQRLHIVAAPGAGKTVLGLEIVRQIGRPALIFSPTIAIREQWAQRLCPLFLHEPPAPEHISRDLANLSPLTLTTYQALDSLRRGDALDALIDTLNRHGPMTLVLDEAHHLRREWWKCLTELAGRMEDVRLVALTATPPYDSSFAEWTRYEQLCGPIDLEIGIPELVRNGDLCPHQDHLILSEPTADALALLDRRRLAISHLQFDLTNDEDLLDWLAAHPWLIEPDEHIEAIFDAPEMLSAVLVMLGAAGRKLPKPPLRLLGVTANDLPSCSFIWLERFLGGLIFRHAADFPLAPAKLKALRARLQRNGLIEGKRVRLGHTRSVFRLMASSIAKLESITAIAKAEQASLGDELRMVVLSDHIRAAELPTTADAEFTPTKLGVAPIFESLRRSGIASDHLAVLTGSLVIIPKMALTNLKRIAGEIGLDENVLRLSDIPACTDHARLSLKSGGTAKLVQLVTALFGRGDIRVLVGTQSLLGEGWDAPTLNSLILASNTASFMLSNQMRGRAIRIDPARPDKVAKIWHLATIEPGNQELSDGVSAAFDWGFLNDSDTSSSTDISVVARRFRAFEGVSNSDSTLIEDGLARLGIDPAGVPPTANHRTYEIAADRRSIAERWQVSLGHGTPQARVRETAASQYAPRVLSWFDTLHALGWSAAGAGGLAAANELREVASYGNAGIVGMGIAGVAVIASIPKLAKAVRLLWRNGSLENSLEGVTWTLLHALSQAGAMSESDLGRASVETRTSMDGRKDIVVTGVKRASERQVMQAVVELLGPVQNPRYLLVRTSWIGWKKRTDYHAVPTALGARKEYAEKFAGLWRENVGSSKLVFTRTREGRRVLLRARNSSFAAGFQRRVDRRSVWL